MTEKSWTLLVFICLLMGTLPADSSPLKYDWLKSNEPDELQKIDKVTELQNGEELEGLETRYDRFGRVFQIPFGRVSGVFKAVAQVVSASEKKIDGNKKNEPPKTMMAPKEGLKDGDVGKSGKKDGKEGGHGSGAAAGFGSRKGASGSASVPSTSPKPKTTEPVPKSNGKTSNRFPKRGPRASKIGEKPEVNEKKKHGLKDGEGTPKDTTISSNPKVKSVGEKGIKSSKPNKIQYGKPGVTKSGEKTGVDKTKSTISTGGKGSNHETGTTRPPMPLKVGKEGGPSPLGPGSRKASVPDEPSPIAPDISFANFKSGDTNPSSSTATAAPKIVKKGKKRQEWWSVKDLIYDLLTHVFAWFLCALIYFKWYIPSPTEPNRAETNELNALIPPLDEASARRRKEKIIEIGLRLLKLEAHFKKVKAEHKSDNRTITFSRMGPIYIRREPPIPPAEDLSENIVLEKITYHPDNKEEWIIGASIDEIELVENYVVESDLSDTEDEDDGGSKKSKKSKNDSKDKKKKTEGNKKSAPTAPPPPPAAPSSTALPTPSLATTGTPEPSKGKGKTTDANEKKEEKKNTN